MRQSERGRFTLLSALIVCMMLTISHGVMGTDAYQTYMTAESMVVDHDLNIANQKHDWPSQYSSPQFFGTDGINGGKFCRQDLGLALYLVPFYSIGRLAAFPFQEPMKSYLTMFLSTLWAMPLASILSILLLYTTVKRLTNAGLAFTSVVLFWFASPFSVYARESMSESLLGLLVTLYFYANYGKPRSIRSNWLSWIALGLLPLVKFAYLLLSVALWIADSVTDRKQGIVENRRIFISALPMIVSVAVDLGFNWFRFHQLKPAYSISENPVAYYTLSLSGFMRGIIGLWMSPTKSILLYAPAALIGLFGLYRLPSSFSEVRLRAILVIGLLTLIHAPLIFWHGDGAWGPRYLMPALPALIICGMIWLDQYKSVPAARKICMAAAILGIAVQFPAWFVKPAITRNLHESVEPGQNVPYFSLNPRVQPIVIEYASLFSLLSSQAGHGSLVWNYDSHMVSLEGLDEPNSWFAYGIRSHTLPTHSSKFIIAVLVNSVLFVSIGLILLIFIRKERYQYNEALILDARQEFTARPGEEFVEEARNQS